MEPPIGEMSGGAEISGNVPKMEETVGTVVIIEGSRDEDLADLDAERFGAFPDPPGKEE